MATGQPPVLTILYMYCTGGTECLSRTPGSHSVCAVRTPLGVDWKILSIRKEPMLSGFSHSKYSKVRVGGCPVAVAHWQSTGGSSQRCPGFDSQRLPAFYTFLCFRLITSKFLMRNNPFDQTHFFCFTFILHTSHEIINLRQGHKQAQSST